MINLNVPNTSTSLQTTLAADAHLAEGQFLHEEQTLKITIIIIIIIQDGNQALPLYISVQFSVCLAYSNTVKMETVSTSETLVNVCKSTQRHIPEDRNLDADHPSRTNMSVERQN
jgi:hypothetical protein